MWLNFSENVYVNENYMKTVSYLVFLVLFLKVRDMGTTLHEAFQSTNKTFSMESDCCYGSHRPERSNISLKISVEFTYNELKTLPNSVYVSRLL